MRQVILFESDLPFYQNFLLHKKETAPERADNLLINTLNDLRTMLSVLCLFTKTI